MQIVIDIPENLRKMIFDEEKFDIAHSYQLAMCVKNGAPLPKGHGRLIDADALTMKLKAWDINTNGIPNYAWKCIREILPIIEADGGDAE